jgi:hypothetical protein
MLAVVAHMLVETVERASEHLVVVACRTHRRVTSTAQIVRGAIDFLSGWDVGDVLEVQRRPDGSIGVERWGSVEPKTSSNASPGASSAVTPPPDGGNRTSRAAEGSSEPRTSSSTPGDSPEFRTSRPAEGSREPGVLDSAPDDVA